MLGKLGLNKKVLESGPPVLCGSFSGSTKVAKPGSAIVKSEIYILLHSNFVDDVGT